MGRIIFAGFLGALVLFFWGFLSWAVLPFHSQTTHTFPNEDAVTAALKSGNAESGAYRIPGLGGNEATKKVEMEKMKAGPIVWIQYHQEGYGEVDPVYYLKGFLIFPLRAPDQFPVLLHARRDLFPRRPGLPQTCQCQRHWFWDAFHRSLVTLISIPCPPDILSSLTA